MTNSFSESYVEAREKFQTAAAMAGGRLYPYTRDDLRGAQDEELACDVAVFGPENAAKAAIVISGTHGAESYCGSAIQHRWLSSQMPNATHGNLKIVLVHAINPWSFSHKTRGTENNVDLNRNFFTGEADYNLDNPSYDRLAPFLHGTSVDASGELAAYRAYAGFLKEHGAHLENESWVGQSRHHEGMFYTGRRPEWSNHTFRRIVNDHLGRAEMIGFIDWHTLLGTYGEIVYLIFDQPGSREHETAMNWWGLSEAGGAAFKSGSVPKYEGLLCKAIRQELPWQRIGGAVIEFGTVDDFSIFRADRLDRWLYFEGRDDPQHDRLREDYKDLCCPRDILWRRLVLAQGPAIMNRLIEGVRGWA